MSIAMKDLANPILGCLGAWTIVVVAVPALWAIDTVRVVLMWRWFLEPLGAPVLPAGGLGFAVAAGVMLAVRSLRPVQVENLKPEIYATSFWQRTATTAVAYGLQFAVGYGLHLWIAAHGVGA